MSVRVSIVNRTATAPCAVTVARVPVKGELLALGHVSEPRWVRVTQVVHLPENAGHEVGAIVVVEHASRPDLAMGRR